MRGINNKFRLHPSLISNLVLIKLISTTTMNMNNLTSSSAKFNKDLIISNLILNEIFELTLNLIYEEDLNNKSLENWLNKIKLIKPIQFSIELIKIIKIIILDIVKQGIDGFNLWLNELKAICPWSDDEDSNVALTPLHRASPFALYLRKSLLLIGKLTYDEAVNWWGNVMEWCEDAWSEPDRRTLRKKKADAYAKAKFDQDYQAARDATSYYDIEDGTSGQSKPQYALLNAAFFEYENGGWEAAHQSLAEAIQIARHVGDSRCLISCSSLSKRLFSSSPAEQTGTASVNEVRVSPTDLLWDIKEGYASGQSTLALVGTLYTARALYHHPPLNLLGKNKARIFNWNDNAWESASQVISASIWSELGFTSLAKVRESICLSLLTPNTNNWNIQLAVLSARAQRISQSKGLEAGIKLMLESVETTSQRKEMGYLEFRAWQCALWNLVEVYAHRMEFRTVTDFLARVVPPVPLHWTVTKSNKSTAVSSTESELFWGDPILDEAHFMIIHGDALQALPLLLKAIGTSNLLSNQPFRLSCLSMIIECRLDLRSNEIDTRRGITELEMIWSQVLGLKDGLLLAYVRELRAKAVLLSDLGLNESVLETAVILLQDSCEGYSLLGLQNATLRTRRLLCLLYHKLSVVALDVDAASRWKDRRDSLLEIMTEPLEKEERVLKIVVGLSEVVKELSFVINGSVNNVL